MQRLWRPWRMAYIKGDERHESCFLCDAAAASPDQDEKNLVVARGVVAFVEEISASIALNGAQSTAQTTENT